MSVYGKTGNPLQSVFTIGGQLLTASFAKDGTQVFPDEPQPSESIKVMTYNVGQWYIGTATNVPADKDAEYYTLQNGMIATANPDILFLCEYFDQFSKTGRTAASMLDQYFPYRVNYGGGSGYMGRAICSKYPLSNYTRHNFTAGNTQYYYDSAEVTIDGQTITLVVLHLMTNPESSRYLQAQELLAYLKTLGTFIAAGDYNTGISPDYGSDNTESAVYAHYIKLFTDEGFHVANCGDFGFLTTCIDGSDYRWDIDNIITSADIVITSAHVDTTKQTDSIADKIDHMPLIAELNISGV